MSKMKVIPSQIFNTGTKFNVTEDSVDGTFGPGTTGFISYVKGRDRDYPNVVFIEVTIIKRGKNGKERFDSAEISTPIFDFKNEHIEKYLPSEHRCHYVHISQHSNMSNNVNQMSDIDYLGWANAYTKYLYKLSCRTGRIPVWPNENENLLNKILYLSEYFVEDPNGAKIIYTNHDIRKVFVRSIRIIESTLIRRCLSYMSKVAQIESNAIMTVLKLTTKDAPIGPKAILKTMETLSLEKSKSLEFLSMTHGKKDDLSENIVKNMSW